MAGAVLLAASAALHAGAGRVFACLLGDPRTGVRPGAARTDVQALGVAGRWIGMAVACGCGGGDAVRAVLPRVLSTARALVLDADALNAIAADTQLQTLLQARARRGRRHRASRRIRWKRRACWAAPRRRCKPTGWPPARELVAALRLRGGAQGLGHASPPGPGSAPRDQSHRQRPAGDGRHRRRAGRPHRGAAGRRRDRLRCRGRRGLRPWAGGGPLAGRTARSPLSIWRAVGRRRLPGGPNPA